MNKTTGTSSKRTKKVISPVVTTEEKEIILESKTIDIFEKKMFFTLVFPLIAKNREKFFDLITHDFLKELSLLNPGKNFNIIFDEIAPSTPHIHLLYDDIVEHEDIFEIWGNCCKKYNFVNFNCKSIFSYTELRIIKKKGVQI